MFDEDNLLKELKFKAVRSSGAGGQHVNKVSSKVELSFNVLASVALDDIQKHTITEKLKNRLTKGSILILQCDDSRSQHKNKEIVISQFLELIKIALKEEKERVPTKIPKSVIKKRLKNKRFNSEKKANRKKPDID